MSSATSWAWISGRETSSILMLTVRPIRSCEFLLKLVDLLPLAADDHARPGAVEDHLDLVARPLDLDLGNRRGAILRLEKSRTLTVLDQQVAELLLGGIPAALPGLVTPVRNPVGLTF